MPCHARLFTQPTSRFTKRQWLAIGGVLAGIEGLALAAYAYWPAPPGATIHLTTPQERCRSRAADQFAARGEWPTTHDGRDAESLISARCALDAESFT